MAVSVKKYVIKKQHLKWEQVSGVCSTGLIRLDSAVNGCVWGRVVIHGEFPPDCITTLFFYASDEDDYNPAKESRLVQAKDGLLYEQTGRYLWLDFKVTGSNSGYLEKIEVYTPGDTFMSTFPEIYREHGSFFHRYMSVFSSMYLDFQQQIDRTYEYMDPDTAPAKLLPLLGEWLGIRMEGADLEEKDLREFIKKAWYFNKYKGTVPVISQIAGLLLNMDIIILERSRLDKDFSLQDRDIRNRLYGNSAYDITILAKGIGSERKRNQVMYFLDQYKPARCRIELVFLNDNASLDQYCYLDMNSCIRKTQEGVLDKSLYLDGCSYLK